MKRKTQFFYRGVYYIVGSLLFAFLTITIFGSSATFAVINKKENFVPPSLLITIPDVKFKIGIITPNSLKPDGKLFYNGIKLYHNKLYSQALSMFKKIITVYPKSIYYPPALIYMSEVLIMLNRPDDAKSILEKAKSFPSNRSMLPDVFFMLAKSYGKNNNIFEEKESLDYIINNFHDSRFIAISSIMLGKLYIRLGNYRKAVKLFKGALSSRYRLLSLIGCAASYAKMRNTTKANLYFTTAYYYAKSHNISTKKFAKLADPYLPTMLETVCNLGEFDLANGLESYLQNKPESIYAHAICLKDQKRYKEASKLFKKAYSIDPTSTVASAAKQRWAIYKILGGLNKISEIEKIRKKYKYDSKVSEIAAIKEAEIFIKNNKNKEALKVLYEYKRRGEAYSIWDIKLNQLATWLIDKAIKRYRAEKGFIDTQMILPFLDVIEHPFRIIDLLLMKNRLDDAKMVIDSIKNKPKYKNRSIVRLAYIALKKGKLKRAETLINSIGKYENNDAFYWNVLAGIAFEKKEFGKVVYYYKKGSEIDRSGKTKTDLAYSYYKIGNFKKVIQILSSGRLSPIDYRILGEANFKLKNYNKAINDFEKAKNDDESNLYFAKALYKLRKTDFAIKILKKLASGSGYIKTVASSELIAIESEKMIKKSKGLK